MIPILKLKQSLLWIIAIINRYSGLDTLIRYCRAPSNTILTFHRIGEYNDPLFLSVSQKRFEEVLSAINQTSKIVALSTALTHLKTNTKEHYYSLTFDDGYADNYILKQYQKYGIPSTIYIATNKIGHDILWPQKLTRSMLYGRRNELDLREFDAPYYSLSTEEERSYALTDINNRLKEIPNEDLLHLVDIIYKKCAPLPLDKKERMLTWDEVTILKNNGITIGAHTMNHAILSRLSLSEAHKEINGSIKTVSERAGMKLPVHFSYPNGRKEDFNDDIVELLEKEECASATTTIFGVNNKTTNRFRLKRIPVTEISFLDPLGNFSQSRFLSETSGGIAFLKEMIQAIRA